MNDDRNDTEYSCGLLPSTPSDPVVGDILNESDSTILYVAAGEYQYKILSAVLQCPMFCVPSFNHASLGFIYIMGSACNFKILCADFACSCFIVVFVIHIRCNITHDSFIACVRYESTIHTPYRVQNSGNGNLDELNVIRQQLNPHIIF